VNIRERLDRLRVVTLGGMRRSTAHGSPPFEGQRWVATASFICVASVLWLAVGYLVGAQVDEEEYRHSIPSTLVAARALFRGELGLWTSQFALGVPQPFAQSLSMHPLVALLAVMPVVPWVQLFYSVHLVLGATGMWLVLRRVGVSTLASATGVATFVLAAPAQNYVLRDFWPTAWSVYTLAPLVLLGILALLEARTQPERLTASVGLGLAAGLVGSTGHQGVVVVFIPAFLVFMTPHVRKVVRDWRWWLLAAAIATIVSAPVAVRLLEEAELSPAVLSRADRTSLSLDGRDVFLRPFDPSAGDWVQTIRDRGVRVPFFGGPAAVLFLVYIAAWRTRVDFVLASLVSLLPLVVPGIPLSRYPSAAFIFRDPLILFAVPIAMLGLDRMARRSVPWRQVAVATVAVQLFVLFTSAWPFISMNLNQRGRPVSDVFVGERLLSTWLRDNVAASDGRVYYSAGVDELLDARELAADGLWRNSMFYRGLSVVNSRVKGVSIDSLQPGELITGQNELITGDLTFLDVAGVRWVLARADEAVSPALLRRAERPSSRGIELVLYEYPSSRGAAFADPSIRTRVLPRVQGCAHDGLLCRDFSQLSHVLTGDVTTVDRRDGLVSVSFTPADAPRLLVVGEMYHTGWRLDEAGGRIEPILGALIGVSVPPGAGRVTLRFRPPSRVAVTIASWFTVVLAGAVWVIRFTRIVERRMSAF